MAKTAKLRVAVIGAGGAGLAMCRWLTSEPQIFDFVVFEKANQIGGTWRYTKDNEENQCHTAMYKNLRTNLPKEVMAYPDFPFPDLPSFLPHETVLKYLEDYAAHFGLMKYIKLQHEVLLVKPSCQNQEQVIWNVIIKDLKNEEIRNYVFDAVVVCNGHFSVPKSPEIPGLDDFPGTVMHSVMYKEPEMFRDQTVVVLGGGRSGVDICAEVSQFAKKIYLVHHGEEIPSLFSENVEKIVGTLTAGFADGSVEINGEYKRTVDTVICCTGYNYSLPFLAPECKIKVRNNRVTSLYKDVFNIVFPTLAFLGLCNRLIPFSNFSIQAQWVASVLCGRRTLPCREEMVDDEELDYQEKLRSGLPEDKMHTLGRQREWQYNNDLLELVGAGRTFSLAVHSLFCHVNDIRVLQLTTYRNTNYAIDGDEWYEI